MTQVAPVAEVMQRRRLWGVGLFGLFAAVVLSGVALYFPGMSEDLGRRWLVLHLVLALVFLPVTGLMAALAVARQQWRRDAVWALLALAGAFAMIVLLADEPALLTTWFPSSRNVVGSGLQLAVLAWLSVVLWRALLPGFERSSASGLYGLGWFLALGWAAFIGSWVATADQAGHVRAELLTWASGQVWWATLVAGLLWAWGRLLDESTAVISRWMLLPLVTAMGVVVMLVMWSPSDANFLSQSVEWMRWTIWLGPLIYLFRVFRDDIRRSLGGPVFWTSAGLFLLGCGAELMAGNVKSAAPFVAVMVHAAPIAVVLAFGLLFRRAGLFAMAPVATRGLSGAGVLITMLAMLAALWGRPAPVWAPGVGGIGDRSAAAQHVRAQQASEVEQRFQQGVAMLQSGEHAHALTAFHRVLQLAPDLPEGHLNMGFALLGNGDAPGAQRFFESASRLDAGLISAYYGLALAAEKQGNLEVTLGAMRTWLHLAPDDDPYRSRAEALFDRTQRQFKEERARAPAVQNAQPAES